MAGMYECDGAHRARMGDAKARCNRRTGKLFVGAPPEWVIDYVCSADCCGFEKGAVVRYLVRNTIDNHRIAWRFRHTGAAQFDKFRRDPRIPAVDLFDKCGGPGTLPSNQDADLQCHTPLLEYEQD
jgi:hypothetical protein